MGRESPRKEIMSPVGQYDQQAHGEKEKWQKYEPNGLYGQRPLFGQCPSHGGTKKVMQAQKPPHSSRCKRQTLLSTSRKNQTSKPPFLPGELTTPIQSVKVFGVPNSLSHSKCLWNSSSLLVTWNSNVWMRRVFAS